MYIFKTEPFGDFIKYSFFNPQSANGFSIVPAMGATILAVQIGGVSVIDGCQTFDELKKNKWYKSSLLFPFPNRLENGCYQFEGTTYHFPINEPSTNNNLHGFANKQEFMVIDSICESSFASIHCRHLQKGEHDGYPFSFQLEVIFKIADPNIFELEMIFQNNDKRNIPVGLGWHPYFNGFSNLNRARLQMPDCQIVEIDGNGIPTSERFEYTYFKENKKLGNTVLDNAFTLLKNEGKVSVDLTSDLGNLHYWQQTGKDKFNFLQVFTPSDRKSIAIEPMTCNINAFNNKEGLMVLSPGEKRSARCGFSFVKV